MCTRTQHTLDSIVRVICSTHMIYSMFRGGHHLALVRVGPGVETVMPSVFHDREGG